MLLGKLNLPLVGRTAIALFIVIFALSMKTHAEAPQTVMQIDFSTSEAQRQWRAVNDTVMGGRSSGGPSFADNRMIFTGTLNTNGGGFSSVRRTVEAAALGNADGLEMRIKADRRAYKLTIQTDARYKSSPISFQADIKGKEHGQWTTVDVPFSSLQPSFRGQALQGVKFDSDEIETLGVILADGQDGPFRLEIEWIKPYSD